MDHESALAALLLLGLWTGPVALLAALNSVAIGLSVPHYRNEWPWSCYLMIALHVLSSRPRQETTSVSTVSAGAVTPEATSGGGARSRRRGGRPREPDPGIGAPFTASQGKLVGWAGGEAKFLWFNPLGALLTVLLAGPAVLAVRLRRPELVWGSIVGVTLMAVQVLALRRYRNGNWTGGLLGGTGAKLAIWAMFAIGLTACRPTAARVEP